MRPSAAHIATAILTVLVLSLPTDLKAQSRDRAFFEELVDSIAAGILFSAWPTATYKGAYFKGFQGDDIVFVIDATSGWTGGDLWLEVTYSLNDGQVKWGKHNGLWEPGTAVAVFSELLEEQLSNTPPSSATLQDQPILSWTIADRCNDGASVSVRFFDIDSGGAWPNFQEVYLVESNKSKAFSLRAPRGAKICFGAAPWIQDTTTYWGVDTDNAESCENCCYFAETRSVTTTLLCD